MTEKINFQTLQMTIPEKVYNYSIEKQREIFTYLNEMNEQQKKTYEIALNHLGTSFDIYRSNGFISWKRDKESSIKK